MTGDPRYMWLMVLFDLPVTTGPCRLEATRFRNFLLKDGYLMLQFSVYARLCKGQDNVDKHMKRLQEKLPPEGHIRALQVTDKQYARMKILLGNPLPEENDKPQQLLFF